MIDRHHYAELLGFGKGTSVSHWCHIVGKIQVGENCWIGPWTVLDGYYDKLTIGDNCSISAGVHIYTHESVRWALSGGVEVYTHKDVKIGNDCHIGPGAKIFQGVHIPDGSQIGANACVYKGSQTNRSNYFRINRTANVTANSVVHLPYPEDL